MQGDGARRARRGPLALLAALLLLAASGRWAATGGGGRGAGTAPRRGLRQVDAQADVGAEEDGGTEDEPEPTTPEPQCSRAETMKVGAELDDECSARCAMASVKHDPSECPASACICTLWTAAEEGFDAEGIIGEGDERCYLFRAYDRDKHLYAFLNVTGSSGAGVQLLAQSGTGAEYNRRKPKDARSADFVLTAQTNSKGTGSANFELSRDNWRKKAFLDEGEWVGEWTACVKTTPKTKGAVEYALRVALSDCPVGDGGRVCSGIGRCEAAERPCAPPLTDHMCRTDACTCGSEAGPTVQLSEAMIAAANGTTDGKWYVSTWQGSDAADACTQMAWVDAPSPPPAEPTPPQPPVPPPPPPPPPPPSPPAPAAPSQPIRPPAPSPPPPSPPPFVVPTTDSPPRDSPSHWEDAPPPPPVPELPPRGIPDHHGDIHGGAVGPATPSTPLSAPKRRHGHSTFFYIAALGGSLSLAYCAFAAWQSHEENKQRGLFSQGDEGALGFVRRLPFVGKVGKEGVFESLPMMGKQKSVELSKI